MSSNDSPGAARWLGRPLRHVDECRSTNDSAATWAREEPGAPHGAMVIADAQTHGRGRLGRSWHSPPGENLYCSTVLRPPPSLDPRALPPLTLAVAVALADTVAALDLAPDLKWPNDLLIDGKKVAGILTESSCQGAHVAYVIVGIGVNLGTRRFPDALADRATSLALATGRPVDRDVFVASLSAHLERWYERFLDGGSAAIASAWRQRTSMLGRPVVVHADGAPLSGVALDLDDEGALRVRLPDGRIERVLAGEIVTSAP